MINETNPNPGTPGHAPHNEPRDPRTESNKPEEKRPRSIDDSEREKRDHVIDEVKEKETDLPDIPDVLA